MVSLHPCPLALYLPLSVSYVMHFAAKSSVLYLCFLPSCPPLFLSPPAFPPLGLKLRDRPSGPTWTPGELHTSPCKRAFQHCTQTCHLHVLLISFPPMTQGPPAKIRSLASVLFSHCPMPASDGQISPKYIAQSVLSCSSCCLPSSPQPAWQTSVYPFNPAHVLASDGTSPDPSWGEFLSLPAALGCNLLHSNACVSTGSRAHLCVPSICNHTWYGAGS